jgi:anaerobic selenocysteine-containing dehydrogenase
VSNTIGISPSVSFVKASRQVLGACPHDCPDTCALVTTVEDGVAVKVQGNPAHSHTGGVLCTKVSRYAERTYHPERVLHALSAAPAPKARASSSP